MKVRSSTVRVLVLLLQRGPMTVGMLADVLEMKSERVRNSLKTLTLIGFVKLSGSIKVGQHRKVAYLHCAVVPGVVREAISSPFQTK